MADLSGAGRSAVFCGSLSEAAGSWGAVQRHNSSQGKPSKRNGEKEEKPKEPCRPNISHPYPGKIYPQGSVSAHGFMTFK